MRVCVFFAERVHGVGPGSSQTTPGPPDDNVRRELGASTRNLHYFRVASAFEKGEFLFLLELSLLISEGDYS